MFKQCLADYPLTQSVKFTCERCQCEMDWDSVNTYHDSDGGRILLCGECGAKLEETTEKHA